MPTRCFLLCVTLRPLRFSVAPSCHVNERFLEAYLIANALFLFMICAAAILTQCAQKNVLGKEKHC